MFFTRNRGWRKASVMEIPESWYLEARWSKRWKLMKRQVAIYGRYGGIWHTWQIWHMWANFQSYSQQRWTQDHLKLATLLSSLSAASLQLHLLLSCSWWVFNFDQIFCCKKKLFQVGGDSLSRQGAGCPGERRVTHFLVFQVRYLMTFLLVADHRKLSQKVSKQWLPQ